MKRRASSILLHITSIPSSFGVGDMGPQARRFLDFLSQTRQSYWQVLPLNPTDAACGNSPYSSPSAFAGNPLLISLEKMVTDGLLAETALGAVPDFPRERVDFLSVMRFKQALFRRSYERFLSDRTRHECAFDRFLTENAHWLEEYALFAALKEDFGGRSWSEWPHELRHRHPQALKDARNRLAERIGLEKFLQYVFFGQWQALKKECNRRGIQIIGDLPFYVNFDSAEVWAHPHFFKLTDDKRPALVAGVPPDYFSKTGQLWGNPVYNWDVLRERGYDWWLQRVEHNLRLFDLVRIDHFRGFAQYWEIRAGENTAVNGRWVDGPKEAFFDAMLRRFPYLPIIAEDLGHITPDVRELIQRYDLPGMRVLLFAFSWDLPTGLYAPHNHVKNCVVYTGTHDNNTVRGWFEHEATPEDKERLFRYVGRRVSVEEVHWEFIGLAMRSVANVVIFPMQDILGLGQEAQMNRPSTVDGNWGWRLFPEQLTEPLARRLRDMTEICGRS